MTFRKRAQTFTSYEITPKFKCASVSNLLEISERPLLSER